MRLLTSALCDAAGASQSGKLDIQGVFHDLYAPGFPAKQDKMVLVLVVEWDREDHGRFNFRVDVNGPDGKPTISVNGYSDVQERPEDRPPARTRLVMPLDDIVFPIPGLYEFSVKIKGKEFEGPSLYLIEMSEDEEAAPEDAN